MRDISQLPLDLMNFSNGLGRAIAGGVIPRLLTRITTAVNFPYESGRLIESGYGYAEGEVVADSRTGAYAGDIEPPPAIKGEKDTGTIVFTTPKPATAGATTFYVKGGRKWFDYAKAVHQGTRHMAARLYVSSYVNKETIFPLMKEPIDKKWSRMR